MKTELIITSALLGAGLAMDAFSVSIADALADADMKTGKRICIAATFACFQFAMPVIGWFLVTSVQGMFESFSPFIPWIALVLLVLIGGGLIKEGIKEDENVKDRDEKGAIGKSRSDNNSSEKNEKTDSEQENVKEAGPEASTAAKLSPAALMLQGLATSIDALSVGFTTASYNALQALMSSVIIGAVTFAICVAGLAFGRRLAPLLKGKAPIAGGIILIAIGIEIWLKGVFF